MSCRAACRPSWWSLSICASRRTTTAPIASTCTARSTKKGAPIEKLALVQAWAEGSNLFSETERAALAWAETVTRVAHTAVPDEAYQAARAVFGEKRAGRPHYRDSSMNAYNRMAISFRKTPQAVIED